MKIENVYVDKDGVICACTVPLPVLAQFGNNMHYYYEKAIQSCKESTVPFEDQHTVHCIIVLREEETPKPYAFCAIEVEVEIVTVMSQPSYNNPDNYGSERPAEPIKVARLITDSNMGFPLFKKTSIYPESPVTAVTSGTKPVTEESQEDMLAEILQNYSDYRR